MCFQDEKLVQLGQTDTGCFVLETVGMRPDRPDLIYLSNTAVRADSGLELHPR